MGCAMQQVLRGLAATKALTSVIEIRRHPFNCHWFLPFTPLCIGNANRHRDQAGRAHNCHRLWPLISCLRVKSANNSHRDQASSS